MFILKKILPPFFFPPGIFITLLLGSGVWFIWKKSRNAGIVNLLIGCLMWLLSISPVSDALLPGLVSEFDVIKIPEGDVIILLGGGAEDMVPDISGVGRPTERSQVRIVAAVRLYERLKLPIIVSGGIVSAQKISESEIMKRFLVELGVPENKITIEDKSRDTLENAKFTRDVAARSGYKKPILVTSASHMKRSLMSFEKFGMNATPFPVGLETWEGRHYRWHHYLPGSYRKLSEILHEYVGILFYRLVYF